MPNAVFQYHLIPFLINDFSDFCMKTETFPRVSLPVDVGQENAWAAAAELGYAAEEDFWVLRELCKFACSVRL